MTPTPSCEKFPFDFSIVFLLRVSLTSIKILTRYKTWPVFLFTKSLTLPSLDTGHCCCCDENSQHAVVRENVAPLANPHATRRAGCQPLKCCWVLSPSPLALLSLSLPLHLLLPTRSLKQSNYVVTWLHLKSWCTENIQFLKDPAQYCLLSQLSKPLDNPLQGMTLRT